MGLFGKKLASSSSSSSAPPPPPPPPARASPSLSMQEVVFKMKFTSKQVGRQSTKSEKQVAVEERKSKEALQRGNIDGARIHAENAIRNKNTAVSYMRLQSQLDAVASKLQSQQLRSQVTQELAGVTHNLDTALGTMDMQKIGDVMEKFVGQSEDLDMQTRYMDSAIGETTAMSTPQAEVDTLLMKIAVENDLEIRDQLHAQVVPSAAPSAASVQTAQTSFASDDIDARYTAMAGSRPGGPTER